MGLLAGTPIVVRMPILEELCAQRMYLVTRLAHHLGKTVPEAMPCSIVRAVSRTTPMFLWIWKLAWSKSLVVREKFPTSSEMQA